MYQFLSGVANKYFKRYSHHLFKWFFNISPMYRRTTGRVVSVAKDYSRIEIKIKKSYKNANYVGTIFGGSLFAATDPIYMVQLIQILGKEYIVWDKSSIVKFKRPASSNTHALFEVTSNEIESIREEILKKKELDFVKTVHLKSKEGKTFCEIEKVIYIADKHYYKKKRRLKNDN